MAPSPSLKEETSSSTQVLPCVCANLSRDSGSPTLGPSHYDACRDVGVLPIEFGMGFRKLTEPTLEWDYDLLEFQSGVETADVPSEEAPGVTTTIMQNVQFDELTTGQTVDFGRPLPSVSTAQKGAEIGDFFARPTLLTVLSWTESAYTDTVLDPWSLYFNNSFIKSKINNYAFFRGRLHVKFIVSAAPFYYGALRAAYTPLWTNVTAATSLPGRLLTLSQRPGVWIRPQDNAAGDIILPFIYPNDFLDITTAATVATMGQFTVCQYAPLASANGATSNGVTIQVYAWLEDDYEITTPTLKLAMQSKDEYGNGPVSAPAASVARAASYLHNVPVIGSFAKATTIGASAVSAIAKIFGWTNVPVIEDVKPFKNLPFHDLASAHISEPTYKFTLDPKAELSVDPAIIGPSTEDEMSFAYLLQKESYLTQSTWATSATPGSLLFSARVQPSTCCDRGTAVATNTYAIATTPVSWVSECFDHWRGDIIFRFKFIASQFHRGRVRITWDPLGDTTPTTDTTNVAFTKIVDLDQSCDVEFIVPYAQALPWLTNNSLQDIRSGGNGWSTSTALSTNGASNGTITVRVLNNLSAPIDTASVPMFVSVRGGSNLEFANPRDMRWGLSTLGLQSGYEEGPMPLTYNTVDENRFDVNWGEPVHSARLLMRRSCQVDTLYLGQTAGITASDKLGELCFVQSRNPPPPGYDPVAVHMAPGVLVPATNYNFSYTNLTPISWFAPGYVGQRGSLRWHYNITAQGALTRPEIRVSRAWSNAGGFTNGDTHQEGTYRTIANTSATNVGSMMLTDRTSSLFYKGGTTNTTGQRGVYLTSQNVNPGIGVEMPHMGRYRFYSCNANNYRVGGQYEGLCDYYQMSMLVYPSYEPGLGELSVQRFCCAGTDFSFGFFLSSPLIYAYDPAVFGANPVS